MNFDLPVPSPYMLFTGNVLEKRRKKIPDNYRELDLSEKLYLDRSDVQAVTHIDFTARIQTVDKESNYKFWQLINAFKQKTGYGILIIWFNVRGEPECVLLKVPINASCRQKWTIWSLTTLY